MIEQITLEASAKETTEKLGKYFAENCPHIHRGVEWVTVWGLVKLLCVFGNDNYNNPKTKAYVEVIKAQLQPYEKALEENSPGNEEIWFGVYPATGTWVFALWPAAVGKVVDNSPNLDPSDLSDPAWKEHAETTTAAYVRDIVWEVWNGFGRPAQ